MIRRFLNTRNEVQLRLLAALAALALSVATVSINLAAYQRYRTGLVSTEQGQLLTMARTIGRGLDKYLEEEISKINLCCDSLEIGRDVDIETVRELSSHLIDTSQGLYRGCICVRGNETLFKLGAIPPEAAERAGDVQRQAGILGKYQGDTGWYEMLIGRQVPLEEGRCAMIFAMDLNCVYQEIVHPVKIGRGGYSVVKDHDLAIIMHHALSQIGMDALYDREEQYPQLDLSSLKKWLEMQRSEREGTGILDSYVWDDPALTPVRRIVAYTTIDIQGEQWIVNSTLPISELSNPLRHMILVMALLTLFYLSAMMLMVSAVTRSLTRGISQKQEIEYLKEINRGMELIARQREEIRHYQRVQSVGMMSSHIAHEFNNYLTPVMVYGEMLEEDRDISEENRAMLREMMKSVGQASQLSRNLLDFSRMDAGGRLHPIDLTEEVTEAVSIVRQLVPRRIAFSAELAETPSWLMGRTGMMQHILMNLCKNAFQAMEGAEGSRLTVTYTVTGDWASLCVTDTGCGIREMDRQRIFEPYYTTKGSSQGTGLGLSVVRSLVEQAHGTIGVDSSPGQGTTFRMTFPVVPSEQALQEQRRAKQPRSILCVHRRDQTLDPWQAWLSALPVAPEYLFSEGAAAARLKQSPSAFDLLVIHERLSSMSGGELAQIIRAGNSRVRIVLLAFQLSDTLKWYLDNDVVDEIVVAAPPVLSAS